MTDFARLILAADTAGLERGETALRDLTAAGTKAEASLGKSMDKIGKEATQAGAALQRTAPAIKTIGDNSRASAAHTANLTSQFNDIGMMLAAGQNPFQLAMQQGTQVTQVMQQMGGGATALRGIGAAFVAMLNPVNLATIGIIGFGAAAVQWLTGTSDKAKTAEDAIDDLSAANRELASLVQYFDVSGIQAMTEEYGSASEEVRQLINLQRQLAEMTAINATREAMSALVSDMETFFGGAAVNIDKMFNTVGTSIGYSIEQGLQAAADALTMEDQLAALTKVRETIELITASSGGMTSEQQAFLASIVASEAELRRTLATQGEINEAIANSEAHQSNANARIADAYNLYANTRLQAEGLAPAIVAADNATGGLAARVQFLAGVFGPAIANANALANALAGAASQIGAVFAGMSRLSVVGRAVSGASGVLGNVFNPDRIKAAAAGFSGAAASLSNFHKSAVLAAQSGAKIEAAMTGRGGRKGGGAAGGVKAVKEEMSEAEKAAKSYSDTMQKYVVDGIGKAVDWMVDGFKGGLSGLVDIFKNTIKQMIAFALKNRIMIGLGLAPGAAMAGGAGGLLGGGGGGGFLGQLGGLGGAFSSGMTGLASAVFGAGGGIGAGFSYLGSTLASATTSLTGFATALGAFAPVIGGIVALGKALFGRTLKDTGIEGTFSSGGFEGGTYKFYKGGLLRSDKTKRKPLEEEADAALDAAVVGISDRVKVLAKSLGLGGQALRKFEMDVKFSTKGMSKEEALQELQNQLEKVADGMAGAALGTKRFAREGEGAMQVLERLSGNLATVNATWKMLGFDVYEASLKGAAGATRIVDAMGGLEAFGNATSVYFDRFYSDAERARALTRSLRAGFREAGMGDRQIPQTMAQYRRLIERLQEGGRTLKAAELINLSPLFAQIMDLRESSRALRQQQRDERLSERQGLLRQLYDLQGRTNMIRRLELRALDPLNRKLQRRIWRLERQAAIEGEREGLERRLLELQGDTAAIRRLELRAIDPSNRAIQRRIWRLEHEARISDQREGLERRLLELQGDTQALRRLELQGLFYRNRELQREIYALEDLQAAQERAREVADQREGLERRLLELQGDTQALRRLELQGLFYRNRELQREIYALEDLQAAQERAREAADQREGLERRYLELMGNTAELRRRELEELDPTNRALQKMIWGLEDAREAMEALDENNFATLIDFQRAAARLAGATSVASQTVPGAVTIGGTSNAVVSDPMLVEIRNVLQAIKLDTGRTASVLSKASVGDALQVVS